MVTNDAMNAIDLEFRRIAHQYSQQLYPLSFSAAFSELP